MRCLPTHDVMTLIIHIQGDQKAATRGHFKRRDDVFRKKQRKKKKDKVSWKFQPTKYKQVCIN